MFSTFSLLKEIVNTPPTLQINTFQILQGFILKIQLQHFDDEKDQVTYAMVQPPYRGAAKLLPNGTFTYTPQTYYSGSDEVIVDLIEVNLPSGILPKVSRQTIFINIIERRHPPTLVLNLATKTMDNKTAFTSSEAITIFIEANTTDKTIGLLYVCDHNLNDQIVLFGRQTYEEIIIYADEVSVRNMSVNPEQFETCQYATSRVYVLSANTSLDFHGVETLTLIAGDNASLYSQPMTLEIYIMINPCVHGACINESCFSLKRTVSFEGFTCTCLAGYEGTYCQLDINECASNPCGIISDCSDLLASYSCSPNIGKVLIFVILLLIATIIPIVGTLCWLKQ